MDIIEEGYKTCPSIACLSSASPIYCLSLRHISPLTKRTSIPIPNHPIVGIAG